MLGAEDFKSARLTAWSPGSAILNCTVVAILPVAPALWMTWYAVTCAQAAPSVSKAGTNTNISNFAFSLCQAYRALCEEPKHPDEASQVHSRGVVLLPKCVCSLRQTDAALHAMGMLVQQYC